MKAFAPAAARAFTAVSIAGFAALVFTGASTPAQAAASNDPTIPAAPVDEWASVKASIQAQRWDAALQELQRANRTGSADWNNLMGYVLRKQAQPNLAEAERHYQEALRISPKHRGALEYLGELYLMKDELPKAEEMLTRLKAACRFGCEELDELRVAIDQHKARRPAAAR